MSRGLAQRARISRRALVLVSVGLMAGLAPGVPGSPAGRARANTGGCGQEWSAAERIGTLPGGLLEVSGFVSSARYPGVAWMIRDSDSPHSLYSFTIGAGGPQWTEFTVSGVSNHDWEDVAYTVGADGRGRVWILENGVETGPKEIYEVLEPDPSAGGTITVANTYRVEYPGGNRNTEAIFSLGGRLVVVAKSNPNRVFRLPWPMSPSRTNRLEDAGRLDVGSFLTMIAVSGDERTVAAVNTQDDVTAFEDPDGRGELSAFVGPDPVFRTNMVKSQREAGDFFPYHSCDIVLVSEDASVWRLSNARSTVPNQPPELPAPVTPDPPPVPPATVTPFSAPEPPVVRAPGGTPEPGSRAGYWMAGADGTVYAFGAAPNLGGPTVLGPVAAVDLEPTPSGNGYWVVDGRGRVYSCGDARHFGHLTTGLEPGEGVSSLSATTSGAGYWMFTTKGRVVTFGDAVAHGDLAASPLNGPVLDSIASPSGQGYYMVGSDGGIFAFGDAAFHGSMGGRRLSAPVQSLVPDPDGTGYWLVAADGGVFAFGAPFRGSMGGQRLNRAITGMVVLWERLPHGRRGRRHLQLLRPSFPRVTGGHAAGPADRLGGSHQR